MLVDMEYEVPGEWTISLLIEGIKYDMYFWELSYIDELITNHSNSILSSLDECSISSILDAKVITGKLYIKSLQLNYQTT